MSLMEFNDAKMNFHSDITSQRSTLLSRAPSDVGLSRYHSIFMTKWPKENVTLCHTGAFFLFFSKSNVLMNSTLA